MSKSKSTQKNKRNSKSKSKSKGTRKSKRKSTSKRRATSRGQKAASGTLLYFFTLPRHWSVNLVILNPNSSQGSQSRCGRKVARRKDRHWKVDYSSTFGKIGRMFSNFSVVCKSN